MRAWGFLLAGCTVLLASAPAEPYYVEASRTAIAREEADAEAVPLLRLERGDQLNAVTEQQTNRFYPVFLPDGETGWVSRYVVRLYEGTAPEGAPVAVMPDESGWAPCPVPGYPWQDAETAYNELSYTLLSSVPGQETVLDIHTELEWTKTYFSGRNWQQALQFCDSLHWGGYDDWRLSNIKELQSITDYGRSIPAIDPIFECPVSQVHGFWSSTTASSEVLGGRSPYFSAVIYFRTGGKGERYKGDPEMSFRPVRGCPGGASCSIPATGQHSCFDANSSAPCPVEGFPNQDADNIYNSMTYVMDSTVPGEETILDVVTGLEWTREVWFDVSWGEALRLCDSLHWAGHDDWRMPNLKELQTLAVYEGVYEIDPIFGQPMYALWRHWSSTTYAYDPTEVWVHSYIPPASYGYQGKGNSYEIRPVRWCGEPPTSTESTSWGSLKQMFR